MTVERILYQLDWRVMGRKLDRQDIFSCIWVPLLLVSNIRGSVSDSSIPWLLCAERCEESDSASVWWSIADQNPTRMPMPSPSWPPGPPPCMSGECRCTVCLDWATSESMKVFWIQMALTARRVSLENTRYNALRKMLARNSLLYWISSDKFSRMSCVNRLRLFLVRFPQRFYSFFAEWANWGIWFVPGRHSPFSIFSGFFS